jgi:acetyltransferase
LEPTSGTETQPSTNFGLDALFAPHSVAVIGATERAGTVGRTVMKNMLNPAFRGNVYPVNPQRPEILGRKAYKSVRDLPEKLDLAVICTPAPTVPALISECVDLGVKSAVVISAGFKEHGEAGKELERQIKEHLKRSPMRIIGPNCLGIMNPIIGLDATFAMKAPKAGSVAFLGQSGALLTAILDWSEKEQVGFSAIVSTGSMLDVGWGDLIHHFGDDPHTKSILMYMESVGDARSFLSAAREVALSKPIIIIKAGRSEAASRAAASHTGSMTGSDEVLEAAFRRCGVLRVHNIADLFYMAEVLGRQPRPKGPRLTILTNAGGPGVLATDALVANGGELADISEETMRQLNEFLPEHWSHNNPVDVLGDADATRYAKAIELVSKDPNSDGMLVILTPQGMTDPTEIAEGLKPYSKAGGRPLLASWMGGAGVAAGEAALNSAGIPTFPFPDTAARAFTYMWRYTYNLRALYETPALTDGIELSAQAHARVEAIIAESLKKGRALLSEFDSKELLSQYGIPTVQTRIARSEEETVKFAGEIGYPVVLKVFSETITHKTDVGGVKLNLQNEAAVRQAFQAIKKSVAEKASADQFGGVTVQPMVKLEGYELILGSSVDPQFGPVLLFGSGGQLVEVYRDRALALPPLNTTLAQRLMEQTKVFKALKGVRGRKPVDMAALEGLLVRFSQLVVEHPWIKEIDINPLLASAEQLVALDARVVLHAPGTKLEDVVKPAIRPYPTQYVWQSKMKNGSDVTLRPIRPEDEPQMVAFHETLSDRTVYLRYFYSLSLSARVAHERLARICFGDYDREMALVAERKDPKTGQREILGVGRLSRQHARGEAEVAVLVSDKAQGQGLGAQLLDRLIQIARAEGITRVGAEMLRDNVAMQVIIKKAGFKVEVRNNGTSLRGDLDL